MLAAGARDASADAVPGWPAACSTVGMASTRATTKAKGRPAVAAKLARYREMRDFDRTAEPAGAPAPRGVPAAATRFVVQQHAARRMHYDFRLELDGVLLSWAVPRGPSLAPNEKRLAVRTEDHPFEYRDFEGAIPQGEYGGGTVLVWDQGTWAAEGEPHAALQRGRLTFTLTGEKLRGRFHLVRTTRGATRGEVKASWLLFKSNDAAAQRDGTPIVEARPESVLSGRTLEEIAANPGRVWHSNRPTANAAPATTAAPARKGPLPARGKPAATDSIESLVARLPTKVALTNLGKVLYPDEQITKASLVAYYATVAPFMLPQVAGRPLSLLRCPDGAQASRGCFFQKHVTRGVPASLAPVDVPEDDGTTSQHMQLHDFDGLVGLVQLGVLEIHTWGCHADKLERPDQIVLDLDPDPTLPWAQVTRAALELRERLKGLGLVSFVKTTGGKGLHVVVPVERRVSWDELKAFSRGIAVAMVEDAPDRFVVNQRKAVRHGKIFIDYLRNGRGATAIAPYSTRARAGATVSVPIRWDELERGIDLASFTVLGLPAVLAARATDPWADYGDVEQHVSAAARREVGVA